MPLFEIAVMEVPSPKEASDGAAEKLVFGPKCVVAKDQQTAALSVVMDDPAAFANVNRARMQILVRPFA